MITSGFIATVAALSVAVPAPGNRCLSDSEGQAVVMIVLPDVVTAVRSRCLSSLPATATLSQAGQVIAARWQSDAALVRDEADRAIDKIGPVALTSMIGRTAARNMVSNTIRQEVTRRLAIANCPTADIVIDALSPLPARNIARAVLAIESGGKTPSTLPFSLCRTKA